jgi:hypothetical protein
MVSRGAVVGIAAASCVAGALLNDLLAKLLSPRKCNTSCFIVIQRIVFADAASAAAFRKAWRTLADHCYRDAPHCLSFELLNAAPPEGGAAGASLEVAIFERYVGRRTNSFARQHDVVAALGLTAAECRVVSAESSSYIESDLGHMERW